MNLLGLALPQLAMLFGAIAAVVTALYVLKLRRRRVFVPFAKLWEQVTRERETTSLFQRLKRLLSLLLQLAFVALLLAALGDPQLSDRLLEGRHIVLLIDTSASMKARDTNGDRTRLQAAVAAARNVLGEIGSADRVMIVRMDAQVAPITPFTSDTPALLSALSKLRATDTRADLRRALIFAKDALHQRKHPMIALIGDGAYDSQTLDAVKLYSRSENKAAQPAAAKTTALSAIDLRGIRFYFVGVGEGRDNVGIVAFGARRYRANKQTFELFLELADYREAQLKKPSPRALELHLLVDGMLTDVLRLSIGAGERRRLSCSSDQDGEAATKKWCALAASGSLLEARLVRAEESSGDTALPLDAFDVDDRAFALLPTRRKLRVLLVSRGQMFIEGALLLDENIEYKRIAPPAYDNTTAARYDAVIFDGFLPKSLPATHTLAIATADVFSAAGIRLKKTVEAPIITEQRQEHAVMRWTQLKDVNVSKAAVFELQPGQVSLASSFRAPLIIADARGPAKRVFFGFDIRQSDLPMRVAWPLMLMNTLDWFSGETDDYGTTFRTGSAARVLLKASAARRQNAIVWQTPDGGRISSAVEGNTTRVLATETGVYQMLEPSIPLRFAANLADPIESNIAARQQISVQGRTLKPPPSLGGGMGRNLWIYLLLAAIGLTLFEWYSYSRRITV